MTGVINTETGLIEAIGGSYPSQLPTEINFGNFQKWRCVNIEQTSIIESWEPYTPPLTFDEQMEFDKSRGAAAINRYVRENKGLSIDPQQSIQLGQTLVVLEMLLRNGSIEPGRVMIESMPLHCFPPCPPYVTSEERKQSYVDELT